MRFGIAMFGLLLSSAVIGCADKASAPNAEKKNGSVTTSNDPADTAKSGPTTGKESKPDEPASNDGGPRLIAPGVDAPSDDASQPTHVISVAAEFYTTGPQQGRPPDGKFEAGTKVTLVESAGSYSRVRSTTGVEAFVPTDALEPLASQADDSPAGDAK